MREIRWNVWGWAHLVWLLLKLLHPADASVLEIVVLLPQIRRKNPISMLWLIGLCCFRRIGITDHLGKSRWWLASLFRLWTSSLVLQGLGQIWKMLTTGLVRFRQSSRVLGGIRVLMSFIVSLPEVLIKCIILLCLNKGLIMEQNLKLRNINQSTFSNF